MLIVAPWLALDGEKMNLLRPATGRGPEQDEEQDTEFPQILHGSP
jgi:hypothetical protein